MSPYYSIADYTPLIQLLVGGLYLSDYFIDRKSFSLPQSIKDALKKSIDQNSLDILRYLQLTNKEWGTSSSDEWNRKLCRSVISLMSLYGCIVLFYCANCHMDKCHTVIYGMSCTGPIISTIITIGYLVWALCLYGHRSQNWHRWVVHIVFLLQTCVFLYFFCINPNVTFYGDEVWVRSILTLSILITMMLWFVHLIKKLILEKILVPYWAEVVKYTGYFFPSIRPTEDELNETVLNLLKILNSEEGMSLKKKTRRLLKDAYLKKINKPKPKSLIINTNMCKGAKIIRRIAMYGGLDDISFPISK